MALTYSESVAAEVRAEMGRQRRTGVDLARSIGWSQPKLQVRLAAQQPFSVDELELIAAELEVPVTKFTVLPVGSAEAAS